MVRVGEDSEVMARAETPREKLQYAILQAMEELERTAIQLGYGALVDPIRSKFFSIHHLADRLFEEIEKEEVKPWSEA